VNAKRGNQKNQNSLCPSFDTLTGHLKIPRGNTEGEKKTSEKKLQEKNLRKKPKSLNNPNYNNPDAQQKKKTAKPENYKTPKVTKNPRKF
jgi:hypothetical protein